MDQPLQFHERLAKSFVSPIIMFLGNQ